MKQIKPGDYFDLKDASVLLDVRTPKEYEEGHIPGAVNMPIFSNEERVEVGTIYKQINPQEALIKGLEFVGPKMAKFVKEARRISNNKKIFLYCWRGGKRSGSMGWLFSMAGLDCQVIEGGYKAYRAYISDQIVTSPLDLVVLSGQTGSSKTEILQEMEKQGHQVIDLEKMAHHKGSAFGALGQEPQPTTEQFQNNLYEVLRPFDFGQRIWLEGESKSIGRVYISNEFWDRMKVAQEIEIAVPKENRIAHLVKSYGHFDRALLKDSFDRILRRLGGQNHKIAIDALEVGDLATAVNIALFYYDRAYKEGRVIRENKMYLDIDEKDYQAAAKKIILAIENYKK